MSYTGGMTDFSTRYSHLNTHQRQAVDDIDGPLLVIAGPGTGKTELLSMRTANILRQTDTLPENILCLTFTESGAMAMRQRLRSIIGADAYRVAIHTFHSFGSEVINQYREYFYHGAQVEPIDELGTLAILDDIFQQLDHRNPLSSKQGEKYTYLRDTSRSISELKQAGLSRKELLRVIEADEALLDEVEPALTEVFANRITKQIAGKLAPIAGQAAQLSLPSLPPAIPPLADSFSLSLARAIDESLASDKTTPITAWRNHWLEKNNTGDYIMKDRKRLAKLRALADIYQSYLDILTENCLIDYDDMIFELVQAMQSQPELRYNLQERYQYIMVDEFQDTNLAQLRILFALTDNPVHEGKPNIMAVGDDDQAIYSFQGADVGNIHRFRQQYRQVKLIALTDNYRSSPAILAAARSVITQGSDRLEAVVNELDKTLSAHHMPEYSTVQLHQLPSTIAERHWLVQQIRQQISSGIPAEDIAVIARRHSELTALVPYLQAADIKVNYERRNNILDLPIIRLIDLIMRLLCAIADGDIGLVDSLLPQLLAQPALGFDSQDVWKLSLRAWRNHQSWTEAMMATTTFRPLIIWLIELAQQSQTTPFELIIDRIIGAPEQPTDDAHQANQPVDSEPLYVSPIYQYYFSPEKIQQKPDSYITHLEALRTFRQHLVDNIGSWSFFSLREALSFLDMHYGFNLPITSIQLRAETNRDHINLMTAHKAKGLEFPHVYICGATDNAWGRTVRSPQRVINYPDNLTIAPAGSSYDERLRLFFVAMTRAKDTLHISYSQQNDAGRATLPASFLEATELSAEIVDSNDSIASISQQLTTDWRGHFAESNSPELRQLLQPLLEQYKLSATDLTTFLDVVHGGPTTFLVNNLLHFPRERSAYALYGTTIHHVLQRAHSHLSATGNTRPTEDILGDFQYEMQRQPLDDNKRAYFTKKGLDSLSVFLQQQSDTFRPDQKTELSFASQGVVLSEVRLTGTLDLVDIDSNRGTITVTDYKTGRPVTSWQGHDDYTKYKLHRYKQQLMFYELLVRHSRDYTRYEFTEARLQFVEPDQEGQIHQLTAHFSEADLTEFARLLTVVWRHIMALDMPDISGYSADYKGMQAFEQDLIKEY